MMKYDRFRLTDVFKKQSSVKKYCRETRDRLSEQSGGSTLRAVTVEIKIVLHYPFFPHQINHFLKSIYFFFRSSSSSTFSYRLIKLPFSSILNRSNLSRRILLTEGCFWTLDSGLRTPEAGL